MHSQFSFLIRSGRVVMLSAEWGAGGDEGDKGDKGELLNKSLPYLPPLACLSHLFSMPCLANAQCPIFYTCLLIAAKFTTHSGNWRFNAGNTGQGACSCKLSGLLQVKGAFCAADIHNRSFARVMAT